MIDATGRRHPPWWTVCPRGFEDRTEADGTHTRIVYCCVCDAPLTCTRERGQWVPPPPRSAAHPCVVLSEHPVSSAV